ADLDAVDLERRVRGGDDLVGAARRVQLRDQVLERLIALVEGQRERVLHPGLRAADHELVALAAAAAGVEHLCLDAQTGAVDRRGDAFERVVATADGDLPGLLTDGQEQRARAVAGGILVRLAVRRRDLGARERGDLDLPGAGLRAAAD